jgi:Mg-chelatase subunit ChlD
MMRFLQPEYLALSVVLLWFWRTSGSRQTRGIRCLIALLLVLSVSQLQIYGSKAPRSVLFVLDSSDSMAGFSGGALTRVNELATAMQPDDRAGLVVFGTQPVVERRLESRLAPSRITSQIVGSGSNIEAALRLARSALPPVGDRRIVLVSDGRETAGNAAAEAALSASEGIPIDVALPERTARGEQPPTLSHLSAPSAVRINEPFAVATEVEGTPGARIEVLLTRNGEAQASQQVIVPQVGQANVAFSDQQRQAGAYVYRATVRQLEGKVEAQDYEEQPSGVGAVVSVAGESRVLYVSSSRGLLTSVLVANNFRVTEVPPSSVPRSLKALDGYDAIVLDDVPPSALDAGQTSAIAGHVERQGAGLLMLGGPKSLEAAGIMEGPLGPLLPIDLRPRSGQRAPAVAMVLIFDKSGSMADQVAGVSKIELARQAVTKVFDVFPATDAIGVIAFDASPVPIAELASGHDAVVIGDRLRRLQPGGATAIAPAMQLARDWLRRPGVAAFSKRHVLLVSDGRSSPADAARLEASVPEQGFELSVVALGADSDRTFLARLASLTGGRSFFPEDLRELPLIVAREAARVAGGQIVEEPFVARAMPHPIVAGLDRDRMPRLGGYVVSASKPMSETVLRSHLDDPILSGWRAGLGKVAVFTADLRGAWSSQLRAWSQNNLLWVQSMRWLMRQTDDGALDARFADNNGQMRLTLDAEDTDGRLLNRLESSVNVQTPSGEPLEIRLRNFAPGQYVAEIPLNDPGPYIVAITARDPDRHVEHRVLRGFYWSADAERRHGIDRATLARLAAAGGGRVLESGQNPFADTRSPDYFDIWPWLTTAALLLFVGDIVSRHGLFMTLMASWLRKRPPVVSRNAA